MPDAGELEDVLASSSASQVSGPIGESVQHRLDVTVTFDGELVPHGTITLAVERVATGKLTGGSVKVFLPTMAAMDYAGEGKRPYFPADKPIPAFKSWSLPAMEPGNMWKQSVSIKLADKGYYQVAVRSDTNALDDKPGQIAGGDIEYWMLVLDGGGEVTYLLDESKLPQGVAVGEGPFRDLHTGSTSSYGDDGSVAYSSSGSISFHVTYYRNGSRRNAKDVELRAELFNDGDTDNQTTYFRTVGSSGIVSVPCPGENQYLYVWVRVYPTAETGSAYTIGSVHADEAECGNTVSISASAY